MNTIARNRITELNDNLRHTYWGGKIMTTEGINQLPESTQIAIFRAVSEFNDFRKENDPHGEHDFGQVVVDGNTCFWKIDYYAPDMEHGSEDPADPEHTRRVLTIMLASEW